MPYSIRARSKLLKATPTVPQHRVESEASAAAACLTRLRVLEVAEHVCSSFPVFSVQKWHSRRVNRTETFMQKLYVRCASASTKETCQELGYYLAQHRRPQSRQSLLRLDETSRFFDVHCMQSPDGEPQPALGACFCRLKSGTQ